MAKLIMPRKEVRRTIDGRIRAANGLVTTAETTGRYEDWLHIVGTWREETAATLTTLYEEPQIAREFTAVTTTAEHSSPRFTFPHAKSALELGLFWLQKLTDGLGLAVENIPDATALESLHPAIYSKCRQLYEDGAYAEAVEKGFKVVRDRLRALTTHETGSEAFGNGKLYIDGAAASHVDDDSRPA